MPLTYLIIAEKEETEIIINSENLRNHWKTLDSKGIDVVPLSVLYSVLLKKSWEVEILDDFNLLVQKDDSFIINFPNDFRKNLSGVSEDEFETLAHTWSETEEVSHFQYSEINTYLKDLIDFAKTSVLEGKDILIYCNL